MRTLWRYLRWLLLIVVLYVVGILLYGTLTDWQPEGVTTLAAKQPAAHATIGDSIITLLAWNVGYGGLGAEEDFYYNRGDFFWTELGKARADRDHVDNYVAGQELTLQNTLADFFLLQEVDSASRRSYHTRQLDRAAATRPDYAVYYAPNFVAKRVPIPVFQPWDHYGRVNSGLVNMTRYQPTDADRIQLPGEFGWPTRLFQLDRCALRQSFVTDGGGELIVYNVHLSAYDEDGGIRRQQMDYLRELVLKDYAAGHYVVVGGDWNQLPPGFNWFSLNPTVEKTQLPPTIGFEFMPRGWQWAYDPTMATVRSTDVPYDGHRNRRSLIDFYLLSPNVKLRTIKTINQSFRFSDHHPVYLEAELQ